MSEQILLPSVGIKPAPVQGGPNVGFGTKGDQVSVDRSWVRVTMESGPLLGKSGWVAAKAVGTPVRPPAIGLYTLPTPFNNWHDTWSSTQKTIFGVTPALTHIFQPWATSAPEGGWWGKFDPNWADDAIANGAVPIVSFEGRDLSLDPTAPQPKYSNAGVLSGQCDSLLLAWATDVGNWQKKSPKNRLICRLDHEGNGKWFPCAAGCNGNSPESAIAVYRYKVRLMRTVAPTLEFLWTPGTSGSGWIPFEDCYPGANFVDWLGGDWYNTSDVPGGWSGHWSEFAEFRAAYDRLCALDPAKGIILGETGSVFQAGHDTAAWWDNVLPACQTMPRIAGIVAFSNNYGNLDFQVTADPTVKAAFSRTLKAGGKL